METTFQKFVNSLPYRMGRVDLLCHKCGKVHGGWDQRVTALDAYAFTTRTWGDPGSPRLHRFEMKWCDDCYHGEIASLRPAY